MTTVPDSTTEPLLRTLSPALRHLEGNLRAWLDAQHRYPLSMMTRATLEGLASDLHRQAEALDVERPLLVIMLMGGTGVGKSTLLNALAGGTIAQASFARPTTTRPGGLLPRIGQARPARPRPAALPAGAARPPGPGAEDPRRYAGPGQQRPGQPREAASTCCRWPTSSCTSARRRNTTTSSAGICSCSSGSGGRLPSSSTNGTAACTPGPPGCGPTRTCCATCRARVSAIPCSFAPAPSYWVDRATGDGAARRRPRESSSSTWSTGWRWA